MASSSYPLPCSRARGDYYDWSGGTMLDRLLHIEVLQRRLFAGDDDVDEIAAAQAMVGDRKQCVRIRRQIDADGVRFLVAGMVDETGILVREAVVVLAPDMGREQ